MADELTPDQIPDEEKALVEKYKKRIDNAIDENKDRFKKFQQHRDYYRGKMPGTTALVRTNLIFSTIATLYPQIYAKNPDISFSPAESVSDDDYDDIKAYGKTAETIVSRMLLREANLKEKGKALIRATMLCEVGWLKVTYQKDIREDPQVMSRMNDIQDNIERLKAKMAAAEGLEGDEDLKMAELNQQIGALESQVETVVSSGLVVDKLMTEDVFVLDPTVRDFFEYRNSSAIAQRVWMDEEKFETNFKRKPTKQATKWSGKSAAAAAKSENGSSTTIAKDREESFAAVFEIWDKDANCVYTWCQGEEGWCREPFTPQIIGRRWYPFFGLCFNPVDGEFYGISDVELLIKLQEEYNQTREKFAEHRKYSIPIRVVRAGGSLTPEDVDLINKAQPGDTVVIGGDSSVPLKNDIDSLQGPPIDPALYDVQGIRADIEMVSGASDAARGMVLQAKTATEAEIMQQGLASRTAERQDTIEDLIQEMGTYSIEILTGELEIAEVQRYAGSKAVWPLDKNVDRVFDVLNLDIRAGSTGKPNKNKERDQWIELMPIIQNSMEKITMLRQQGMDDMADAVVELTRESLRRFDERIDIDSFLPRKKQGQPDPAQMQMQMQQMQQQGQEQQQQAAEQVQALTQQLQEMQAKEQSQIVSNNFAAEQADLDRNARLREAEIKANAEATKQGVAEALSNQQQILAKLKQFEQAIAMVQQGEGGEGDEAMQEGLQQILQAIQQQAAAGGQPISITVPVTIDGKGQVVKQGLAVPNPDGSYSMQITETPGGGL
jgi:hypothetical protein